MKLKNLAAVMGLAITANAGNPLPACWKKQVKPFQDRLIRLTFSEKRNEYYHSAEPWQQLHYTGNGMVWCGPGIFMKRDSVARGKRRFFSSTQLQDSLLLIDDGKKIQAEVTDRMMGEELLLTARYTPAMLIDYFYRNNIQPSKGSDKETVVYETTINKTITQIHIGKRDHLVRKIITFVADDFYGDVVGEYSYSTFAVAANGTYPQVITIKKLNGRLADTVLITAAATVPAGFNLLKKPEDYRLSHHQETTPEIKTVKHNEHIYFIELRHAGTRVLAVEFKDYFLVSDAPLSSSNGELILGELKKIAATKPVRYFTFGHWHPHYTGGMRPFVHRGATVLAPAADGPLLRSLVSGQHTLDPDSLQLQPKPLVSEEVKDSLVISDGNYSMRIFFIGSRSAHTSDYMISYFPAEKVVFEGDLVWIKKEGPPQKASDMQAGLYHAIRDLGIDVTTLIQSWGIGIGAYKTIIPFSELEASVLQKQ